MDDEIIYYWCFNYVKCFDSTPSPAIIVLVDNLESFSSLRSQHSPYKMVVDFNSSSPIDQEYCSAYFLGRWLQIPSSMQIKET